MFFKDHEKLIYRPPGTSPEHPGYDPLAIDRGLQIHTKGTFPTLVEVWKAVNSDTGDISDTGKAQARFESAAAELQIVRAARLAFEFPDFPAMTDGEVLERLCHYLSYMEGKG